MGSDEYRVELAGLDKYSMETVLNNGDQAGYEYADMKIFGAWAIIIMRRKKPSPDVI